MEKPNIPSFKVCFFMLVLLSHHFIVFAQRPPTSGPNPDEGTNLTPYFIGGSGLVLGAGSYFYLKSKGPKVPVTDNLQDYLWRQNIMPTTDALNLMYALNPGLRGKEMMRAKKKLVDPDFPEIPEEIKELTVDVPPISYVMPEDLKKLVENFKSSLEDFRAISVETTDPDASQEAFNKLLNKLEDILTAPERFTEARSSARDLLMRDLISATNQTLDETIQTQELSGDKLNFLNAIAEDLEGLVYPNLNPRDLEVGEIKDAEQLAEWYFYLASIDNISTQNWNHSQRLKGNIHKGVTPQTTFDNADTKWFAFAVYKYNTDGDLITKGKEVEKRYQIYYTSPALKDREGSFHAITGNASYGIALLGNGKYFIKVKDGEEEVPVQNPVIHFGQAFHNPLKELHNELTKVPIYLLR